MTYIGIDVSKATFVVAYSSAKDSKTKTYANTASGIHKFIQTLPPEAHCVMEATGNYSMLASLSFGQSEHNGKYGEST